MKPGRAGFIVALALTFSAQRPLEARQNTEVTVVLPDGNALAGRKAFQDLKCDACHLVAGEKDFRPPVAELTGPDLDQHLRQQTARDLAAAIIAPSHAVSVRSSPAVKAWLQQSDRSPMADYTRVMTVRQLADLVTYLRSLR